MNFETPKWGRSALDVAVVDDEAAQRRRRRNIILAAVAGLVIVILAFLMFRGGSHDGKPAGKGGAAAQQQQDIPSVTIVVPGRQQVARMISATGNLAAKRDLPVGISGEGGQVVRVLAESRARIGRLDVRAPASGLVLDRTVEIGQIVGPGSGALFRIAEGGQMELRAKLAQQDLERLSVGVPAVVTPVGSTKAFKGAIWQISPIIDPQNRQGEARIAVPYSPELRPGGFAAAQITAGSVDAPLLPDSAVLNDDNGSYVYLIGPDNKVERRNVKVGSVTDKGVVIAEGLSGTERVVYSAGAFLNPHDKVKPKLVTAATAR
jgi:multidrug efflux pump subunit AcrA (membrane-fusion protein)